MLKDPVRCGELCRVFACVAVWPCGAVAGVAPYGGVHDGPVRVWRCGRVAPYVWVCVVFGVRVAVWPVWRTLSCVWLCACMWLCVAGVVWVRKGGARGGPPLCGVQAAVSYSPTPWRVQYHRRWQS